MVAEGEGSGAVVELDAGTRVGGVYVCELREEGGGGQGGGAIAWEREGGDVEVTGEVVGV